MALATVSHLTMCHIADHTAHTSPGDLAANSTYFETFFNNHSTFSDCADTSRLAVRTGISQASSSQRTSLAALAPG